MKELPINQIIQGDCLEVLSSFPADSVDLVVTSPPYGEIRDYNGFDFDFKGIAGALYRVLKPGGVIVWVVNDQVVDGSESGESFRQALYFKELGLSIHDTMIYDKGKVVFPDANRYHNCFEYMFVISKGRPNTTNLITDRKNKWQTDRKTSSFRQKDGTVLEKKVEATPEIGIRYNIWSYSNGFMQTTKDEYAFDHPAMFPEALAADHIKSWSKEGDIVLDPMCGSGTTLKMAQFLGRKYIGIDISKEYCKIAAKRIRQKTLI